MEKSKHAVAEVKRLQKERLDILDLFHAPFIDSDDYEDIKEKDKENWKALKKSRENLYQTVCDIYGENLFDLKSSAAIDKAEYLS